MPYCDPFPAVHGSLLVLEDDEELGPLLQDVLTMAGYDVFLAGTHSEAMAHLTAMPMAAAVLEWSTQEGDAGPVADHLLSSRIPYVVASGSVARHLLPARHRWARFLQKPFSITDLITAVEASRDSGVPGEAL
jgi:DNA-binding response OmpR family regulator